MALGKDTPTLGPMRNDFDLPNRLFIDKTSDGPNPDELDPPPRISRRYHHLRSLAANGDLGGVLEDVDTLAFLRLCMLRLAERGAWKEAARIADQLLPCQHQRLPDACPEPSLAIDAFRPHLP